jgi:hypothetical protein
MEANLLGIFFDCSILGFICFIGFSYYITCFGLLLNASGSKGF